MKGPIFLGTATALATPFDASGGVDVRALENLANWQISEGVNALVACGTTGEASTLEDDEWEVTVEAVIRAADGRVPVIAGTGGNSTAHVLRLAKRAKALGAQAQLCVTPYYNKTSPAGLIAHYSAIADEGSLPVVIYNVPSRTGLNMAPETLAELSRHERILAMKEASGDIIRVADMMRLCEGRIAFYSGTDEVIIPMMALGGQGVISVVANVAPALTSRMTALMLAGDLKGAAELQLRLLPLIHACFCEVNPIPVKSGLHALGKCLDALRLPLVCMTDKNRASLLSEMKALGLLP
ncbi:MAG TPA: 4-hydroxy-tetrahydrodipicolinate synthase [Candidatus Limnocylindria bacterium]|nr:4-hydroxy-tetrahydrodipicolinate synthase [Candidatus Limnocylindria bacterium]